MDKRIDLFNYFRNEGLLKNIQVYAAKETLVDPYEKNETQVFMNPLTIKALVRQVSFESLHWKYYGQIPVGSIELITEKKNKTLLRTAEKIIYNKNEFKCYKEDSKDFAILERDDYIIVVLAKKV